MTPVDGAADAAASTSDPLAGARDWSVGADDDDGDHPPAFDSPGGYSGCGDDEPTALPDAPSELMPPPPPPLDAADGPAAKKARKGGAPGERRKRKNSMEKLGPQPPPSQPGAPGGPMTAEQLAQIAADGGAYHVSKRGRRVFKPFAFWVAGEGIENGRRASGKFAAPVAFRRNGVRRLSARRARCVWVVGRCLTNMKTHSILAAARTTAARAGRRPGPHRRRRRRARDGRARGRSRTRAAPAARPSRSRRGAWVLSRGRSESAASQAIMYIHADAVPAHGGSPALDDAQPRSAAGAKQWPPDRAVLIAWCAG